MIIDDHEALIKCDQNTVIWRYIDLHKLEKLFADKALFFCRSDKFSDPYEGAFPKNEFEYRKKNKRLKAFKSQEEISNENNNRESHPLSDFYKNSKRSYVVNCWHINKSESDAMWRLYLKTNEGVAIQSNYQKLHNSLNQSDEEIFISKVRYIDYEIDIWYHKDEYPFRQANTITPIIHKRIAFSHENELRIFQQVDEALENEFYWDDKLNPIGKNISCDLSKLIDKIILPPTSGNDVLRKTESILKKYNFNVEIIKSKLDEPPLF